MSFRCQKTYIRPNFDRRIDCNWSRAEISTSLWSNFDFVVKIRYFDLGCRDVQISIQDLLQSIKRSKTPRVHFSCQQNNIKTHPYKEMRRAFCGDLVSAINLLEPLLGLFWHLIFFCVPFNFPNSYILSYDNMQTTIYGHISKSIFTRNMGPSINKMGSSHYQGIYKKLNWKIITI